MNTAGLEMEGARKFSLMEISLGEIFWRLYIPDLDYRSFRVSQRILSVQIQKRARKFSLPFKILLWIICFSATIYFINYYRDGGISAFLAALVVFILALWIFSVGNSWAMYKALYDGSRSRPSAFLIGEGGLLHVADFDVRFFPWENLQLHSGRHGHYLVAENFTVLILPETVLGQHPAASEIIAFIDRKMARPTSRS